MGKPNHPYRMNELPQPHMHVDDFGTRSDLIRANIS